MKKITKKLSEKKLPEREMTEEEKEIQKETERYCRILNKHLGIDLTLFERLALKIYLDSFSYKLIEENKKYGEAKSTCSYNAISEGKANFLRDFFGIDIDELYRKKVIDDRFKQYCQDHIREWRDERNLL